MSPLGLGAKLNQDASRARFREGRGCSCRQSRWRPSSIRRRPSEAGVVRAHRARSRHSANQSPRAREPRSCASALPDSRAWPGSSTSTGLRPPAPRPSGAASRPSFGLLYDPASRPVGHGRGSSRAPGLSGPRCSDAARPWPAPSRETVSILPPMRIAQPNAAHVQSYGRRMESAPGPPTSTFCSAYGHPDAFPAETWLFRKRPDCLFLFAESQTQALAVWRAVAPCGRRGQDALAYYGSRRAATARRCIGNDPRT
jgi:hypothetical protein